MHRPLILPLLFALTLPLAAVAEIRVYQPPATKEPVPTVSRGIEKTAPAPAMAEKPQPAPAPAQQTPRQLEVFVTTTDLPNVFPAKLEELRKLPELKEFNLVPEAYIDEQGAQAVMKVMSKFIPRNLKLSDEEDTEIPGMPTPDFSIDNGNELALSYGIQNQSTIVYRDPTGAVRLYNLNNEVDKLQRQLARELQDAQPAR